MAYPSIVGTASVLDVGHLLCLRACCPESPCRDQSAVGHGPDGRAEPLARQTVLFQQWHRFPMLSGLEVPACLSSGLGGRLAYRRPDVLLHRGSIAGLPSGSDYQRPQEWSADSKAA